MASGFEIVDRQHDSSVLGIGDPQWFPFIDLNHNMGAETHDRVINQGPVIHAKRELNTVLVDHTSVSRTDQPQYRSMVRQAPAQLIGTAWRTHLLQCPLALAADT